MALVEFALVLPLVMLLLVGMLDFGRAFTYWIDATHLANEAARFASVNKLPASCTAPCTTIEEWVTEQARAPEADVKIYLLEANAPAVPGDQGEALCVLVKAGSELDGGEPVFKFISFLNLGSKTLKAKSIMRIEQEFDDTAYDDAGAPIPQECTD